MLENISIGKYIIEKIKRDGFTRDEIANNDVLKAFILQILNEQKISHFKRKQDSYEFEDVSSSDEFVESLWVEGENTYLLPSDMIEIITQLLGKNPIIKISSQHMASINKNRAIPGMSPTVKRVVHEDDSISFGVVFPEFEYIDNYLLDQTSPIYSSLVTKVLVPYMKILKMNDCRVGTFVPPEIENGMLEIFEEVNKIAPIGELDKKAMVDYTLYNILNLANPDVMKRILEEIQVAGVSGDIEPLAVGNAFEKIMTMNRNPKKELEGLLNGVAGQIQMNDYDETILDSKVLERKLKTAYFLYNGHERNKKGYQLSEIDGYREKNVGIGRGPNQKDILLHRNGDNLGLAMAKLCRDVTRVMKRANDPSVSHEEYMRYIAVLHFRFISIHPFPDCNR